MSAETGARCGALPPDHPKGPPCHLPAGHRQLCWSLEKLSTTTGVRWLHNPPLTVEQITDTATPTRVRRDEWSDVTLPLCWLGEDSEQALVVGHVDQALMVAALCAEDYIDPAEIDVEDVQHRWLIAREHVEGCREHLDPDDTCTCGDEGGWWADLVNEGTPGAVAITWWSV